MTGCSRRMKNVTISHSQERQSPLSKDKVLFSYQGRIKRRTFWLASLAMVGIFFLIVSVLALFQVIGLLPAPLIVVCMLVLYAFCFVSQYAIAAKRWHDRNRSGWWSLISLIPLVNFWMLIELGFLKGTDEPNRFGPPA